MLVEAHRRDGASGVHDVDRAIVEEDSQRHVPVRRHVEGVFLDRGVFDVERGDGCVASSGVGGGPRPRRRFVQGQFTLFRFEPVAVAPDIIFGPDIVAALFSRQP